MKVCYHDRSRDATDYNLQEQLQLVLSCWHFYAQSVEQLEKTEIESLLEASGSG